jgi:hypothetical protein
MGVSGEDFPPGFVAYFGRFAPAAGGDHRGAAQVVGEGPFQAGGAAARPGPHGDALRTGVISLETFETDHLSGASRRTLRTILLIHLDYELNRIFKSVTTFSRIRFS